MRIISDFRDYYDSLSTKDGPIYVRNSSREDMKLEHIQWGQSTKEGAHSSFCIFGFCGEVHICKYRSNEEHRYTEYKGIPFKYNFYLNLEDDKIKQARKFKTMYGYTILGYDPPKSYTDKFKYLFNETTPIWVIYPAGLFEGNGIKLIRNPNLTPSNLVNYFGVPGTFQKIEQYLSNLAFPEKPIPKISDEVKIEQHGFDKFSFRKDKKEKK